MRFRINSEVNNNGCADYGSKLKINFKVWVKYLKWFIFRFQV
jgi:hypothetical protein